jgi:hypothetical protein
VCPHTHTHTHTQYEYACVGVLSLRVVLFLGCICGTLTTDALSLFQDWPFPWFKEWPYNFDDFPDFHVYMYGKQQR